MPTESFGKSFFVSARAAEEMAALTEMAETPSGKIPSREEMETRLREGKAAVAKIFR